MDIAAQLAKIDFFAPLAGRAAERLAAQSTMLDLAAGDTSNALEGGSAVLFIVSGRLRASAVTKAGIGFADLEPGDIHGLADAAGGGAVPPCALLALEALTAFVVPADALLAAVRSSAAASFALAQHLARLLSAQAAGSDPLQKVYRDILRAARPIGDSRWTIDPLPRHRDLAAGAGVEETEAAAAVAHLIRIGVARRRYPALDIEDREALRAMAG